MPAECGSEQPARERGVAGVAFGLAEAVQGVRCAIEIAAVCEFAYCVPERGLGAGQVAEVPVDLAEDVAGCCLIGEAAAGLRRGDRLFAVGPGQGEVVGGGSRLGEEPVRFGQALVVAERPAQLHCVAAVFRGGLVLDREAGHGAGLDDSGGPDPRLGGALTGVVQREQPAEQQGPLGERAAPAP
jgi:hypothetical protein